MMYQVLTKGILICYNTQYMKKITKQSIIILGAIILFFAIANSTFAAYGHYAYSTDPVGYEYQPSMPMYYPQPVTNNPIYPAYYQQPVVYPTTTAAKPTTSVVNNYYYQTAPATKTTTTTNTTSNTPTFIPVSDTSRVNTSNGLGASAYNAYPQTTGNGITALSLRGSGSFMPSSIWQWILVVILILAIIVIARMFVHKPDPADHDVHIHNAPAH
jgi:hypothetical protein